MKNTVQTTIVEELARPITDVGHFRCSRRSRKLYHRSVGLLKSILYREPIIQKDHTPKSRLGKKLNAHQFLVVF